MKIVCKVCPHGCSLEEGRTGFCRARKNVDGQIVSVNYGKITGLAVDPIEKKPLKRFYPGRPILSVGSYGCNLRCPFCQNHEISMKGEAEANWVSMSPEELAQRAIFLKERGNLGLAYTYNEPCVGYEYVLDTARLIRDAGMKNVLVTNGCVNPWAADELIPWIDAMNIDLKGFTQEYYRRLGGDLDTVKVFIEKAVKDCHVELTTLLVPGEHGEGELEELVSWVSELSPDIPLHISRFFPRWEMAEREATPVESIWRVVEMAKQKLNYVYPGNC